MIFIQAEISVLPRCIMGVSRSFSGNSYVYENFLIVFLFARTTPGVKRAGRSAPIWRLTPKMGELVKSMEDRDIVEARCFEQLWEDTALPSRMSEAERASQRQHE